MGQWLLQDTPVFWFIAATPTPPARPPVLTTYETGFLPGVGMNMEEVAPKLTPEQEQAIWRGDARHYPGALPGGTPR